MTKPPASPAIFLLLQDNQSDIAALVPALSASSRAALNRYTAPARNRQFVLGRWLMSQAASHLFDRPVLLEEIAEGPQGFPIFARQAQWHASISHSHDWLGVVVSSSGRIGLDIENMNRQRQFVTLAHRAFHVKETQALAACAPEQQADLFYRIWTWREAAYKAGLWPNVVSQNPTPICHQDDTHLFWQHGQEQNFVWTAVADFQIALAPEIITFPAQK